MNRRIEHRDVATDEHAMRLDRWFRRHFPRLGHVQLQRMLRTGQVRVDGGRAKANLRLAAGQQVRVPPLPTPGTSVRVKPKVEPKSSEIADLKKRILYRDDTIIALDKPAGLAVQGGTDQATHVDAMLDGLRFGSAERPRLVHRLDQDTTGVLILARTAAAARELGRLFKTREVEKVYWAILVGVPKRAVGRVDLPLAKLPGRKGERVVVDEDDGKRAVTDYRVLDAAGRRACLVELRPRTGRTHQLRAHMAALGTPILGDGKYAGQAAFLPGAELARRLHLHARSITVPVRGGRPVTVEAPLPRHMRESCADLGLTAASAS